MPNVLYFAGDDNWTPTPVLGRRFSRDRFIAVQADADPATFYTAVANAAPIDLLIIGTHGGPASFLLISGTVENLTQCDVSYDAGGGRSDAIHIHPAEFGRRIRPSLRDHTSRIQIISCSVAGGADGKTFVMALAAGANATVLAADNTVRVQTVGTEMVTVTVLGGAAWASTAGTYPVEVSGRGGKVAVG